MSKYSDNINTYIKGLTETVGKDIEDKLSKIGSALIKEILDGRTYKHDTLNLKDSYGYGIYRDNVLVRKGFIGNEEASEPKRDKGEPTEKGRESVNRVLGELQGNFGEGYTLVIIVSLFYADKLERIYDEANGDTYKVISFARSDIEEYFSGTNCKIEKISFK